MARKARKKSAAKTKKKRKVPAKRKTKVAARKKPARKSKPKSKAKSKPKSKAKPKGIVATIVADVKAFVDTLTDAEQLHKKLEPRGSPESEQ